MVSTLPAVLAYPMRFLNEIGWIGVDLFFVLSGFLVSGLIFIEIKNKKQFDIKRFLIRRGFKIYPTFYLLIGVTLAVSLISQKEIRCSQVLSEALFYQNYVPGLWNHTWSLGVEEQFYIFVALTLSCLAKVKWVSLFPIVCSVFLIVCPILRTVYAIGHEFSYIPSLTATHFRIDSLLLGSLLSYLNTFKPEKFTQIQNALKRTWPVAIISSLLLPWFFPLTKSVFMPTIGFTVLAIFGGIILVGLLDAIWHLRIWKTMAFLGGCSYPIYLFHMPCKFWPKAIIQSALGIDIPPALNVIIFFISAIVLGVFISLKIELPLLKMRNRLIK